MAWRPIDHTADTGIEVTATTRAGLLAEAAAGMFGLMYEPCVETDRGPLDVVARGTDTEELLVSFLSTLLAVAEAHRLALCRFEVDDSAEEVRAQAWGCPVDDVALVGPPIKAVTYHGLSVKDGSNGWWAQVIFDV